MHAYLVEMKSVIQQPNVPVCRAARTDMTEDAAVAQVARKSRQFPFGSIPTCQPLRGADPQGGGIAAGSETGDLRRGLARVSP